MKKGLYGIHAVGKNNSRWMPEVLKKRSRNIVRDKRWIYSYIQTAKELEHKMERETPELADAIGIYTDRFYPADVVKEILLDGSGSLNGEVPPLSKVQEVYYYCQELAGEYSFCDVEEVHAEILMHNLLGLKFWLPIPSGHENIRFYSYRDGEYEDSPLYFMDICVDAETQVDLIRKFCRWYGDTDQDALTFGTEFYFVVSGILDGILIMNPKYLLLKDVLEEILVMLPSETDVLYLEGVNHIEDGCQPIPCS